MPSMYNTAHDAETAFYLAIEEADLIRMMEVWDDDEKIACIHPMGPRLQGQKEVKASWRRIFANGARMRFRISDADYILNGALAVHTVHENITITGRDNETVIVATNVYRRKQDGWRMILHHASPIPSSKNAEPSHVLH